MQDVSERTLPDIRHTVDIKAPILKVWNAVSTPEGIAAWFMPNDFQPQIGHEFAIETPFGRTVCKVLELDPPNRLTFSWDDFGWRVSFELKDLGAGLTQLTFVHSGWGKPDEIIAKVSEKQSVIHERMDIGWGYMSRGLRDKLSEAKLEE